MIANFATILIGLWLAYRAIFSIPAGEMNQTEMIVAGVAVILLALWARRTDFMGWQSGTSIVLGLIILVLAAVHRAVGVEPLVSFWMNHGGHCCDVVDAVSARYGSTVGVPLEPRGSHVFWRIEEPAFGAHSSSKVS